MLPTSCAKTNSRIQLLIQQAVPLALESAQSIIIPTPRNSIVRVPSLPGKLTISNIHAEAVLHKLMTNCSPLVADFHHGSCGADYIPYNPICTACPHDVKESVKHMILRCVGRAGSHRKHIGRIGGNTVGELCRKKPLEVLSFLDDEKLLESNFKR